jgi:hypothetical protein
MISSTYAGMRSKTQPILRASFLVGMTTLTDMGTALRTAMLE